MLGSRIERKRKEMHDLMENGADPIAVLKVSQELDLLIVKHTRFLLKQKGVELLGEKRIAQNTGIVHTI